MKLIIYILLLFCFNVPVFAQEDSWLIGKWLHTGIKDPKKTELITFFENGQLEYNLVSSGMTLQGTYEVNEDDIDIETIINGLVVIPMKLKAGEQKGVLYFYDEKIGQPLEFYKQK